MIGSALCGTDHWCTKYYRFHGGCSFHLVHTPCGVLAGESSHLETAQKHIRNYLEWVKLGHHYPDGVPTCTVYFCLKFMEGSGASFCPSSFLSSELSIERRLHRKSRKQKMNWEPKVWLSIRAELGRYTPWLPLCSWFWGHGQWSVCNLFLDSHGLIRIESYVGGNNLQTEPKI